jgi:V/A-type H+/Na+-transporting ATPase subunit E
MNGLERLIQKIEAEAEDQAAKTVEAAQMEASGILESAEIEAEDKRRQLMSQLEVEVKGIRERKVSRAELAARDEVLTAKREALESVYTRMLKIMETLEGEALFEFLLRRIQAVIKSGAVVIALNDQTAGQFPMDYLERILEVYRKEGVTLELEEQRRQQLANGFQLIQGGVVYDFTYPALVSEVRESLEPQLAQQLFKGV